jgi:hypothetical protein
MKTLDKVIVSSFLLFTYERNQLSEEKMFVCLRNQPQNSNATTVNYSVVAQTKS